jgi:flagellar basal-body rod modification protein FlgD
MPEIGEVQSFESDAAVLRELQNKRQKQPVSKNGKTPMVRKSGYDALDKNSFLKLLVTQLSKQDPTNPMNDREFISQMAQFSSLEQMNNVANSMNKLRGSQANQLIGKMIEGKDFVTEKPIQGIVTSTIYQPDGNVLLKVGGRFTKLDDVSVVTEVTPVAAPVTPAGHGNVSRETMAETAPQAAPKPAVKPGTQVIPVAPQVNPNQAAKAYEANQKSAEKPAAQPGTTESQKNKVEVSKGE